MVVGATGRAFDGSGRGNFGAKFKSKLGAAELLDDAAAALAFLSLFQVN